MYIYITIVSPFLRFGAGVGYDDKKLIYVAYKWELIRLQDVYTCRYIHVL